jgi:hypothetical protein
MKPARNSNSKQSHQGFSKKPKPEIRDDLDSLENDEFQTIDDLSKIKN